MTERNDTDKVLEAATGLNALRMNNSNGENPDKAREGLILRGVQALADLPEEEFLRIIDQLGANGDE